MLSDWFFYVLSQLHHLYACICAVYEWHHHNHHFDKLCLIVCNINWMLGETGRSMPPQKIPCQNLTMWDLLVLLICWAEVIAPCTWESFSVWPTRSTKRKFTWVLPLLTLPLKAINIWMGYITSLASNDSY